MSGFFDFMVKVLVEIIVLIIIIVLLIYAVQSVGALSTFEDRKYIALVKFIEKTLNEAPLHKTETWRDYITYNPVRYSILFNYTDKRIYLYKCDSPEMKVIFYNITDNIWAKDLKETNCYPIYTSEEVLDNETIVNISGGVMIEVEEGGKTKPLYVVLYNLGYTEACWYEKGVENCIPRLIINKVYNSVIITNESKIIDISSYFFGLNSSIKPGNKISNDCRYVMGYKKCVVDANQLLKDGKLVMPKLTVSVSKTEQKTIISFTTTI